MSKTIMWVVVVCAVAVGGYFIYNSPKGEEGVKVEDSADTKEEASETPKQESGKKMAFSEFVKQGGDYKCDVKQAVSDFETSGTVYMSGGNMRGEFNTIAEGRSVDSQFISKDGFMYTWSSLAPFGVKAKVVASAGSGTSGDASGTYSWNAETIGDYNCEAWTADSAKFALPAGVKFTER